MNPPRPGWSASPALGIALAKLVELYARAQRVDTAHRMQRMERLARLIEKRNQP